MTSVLLSDLSKVYDSGKKQVLAVDHINLEINDGEFIAFLGPSGCGKTSTLRMIAGLEDITGGEISLGSDIVNNLTSSQRDIAMAFETYALYSHMSVQENISFCLNAKGLPESEISSRVNAIAETLKISDLLCRKPSELSGGQQQMVSLARALVRRPSVFLLDEPLSHLDTASRTHLREMIKLLHYEIETTMIYVTHDQVEALALADRIVVMNHAKIEQVGTRDDLYHRPDSLFVAQFVGDPSINLVSCDTLENCELRQSGIGSNLMKFVIEELIYKKIVSSGINNALVGIRPQDLSISQEGLKNFETISGKVSVFEFIGEYSKLQIDVNGALLMALTPANVHFNPGEDVKLYYDPKKVLVFDPSTSLRISQ